MKAASDVRRTARGLLILAPALLLATPGDAGAIPAFARKYRVSCSLCHRPFPRLSAFGEQFAANGFRLAPGRPAPDTVGLGDPLLQLERSLPLALRLDQYLVSLTETQGGAGTTDLQTPWGIKLLTGGQISESVSYYLYFYLSERGEVAGLEDAYLQFNDVLGSGVDLVVGQFQVSDPIYKRELRLEYEDYALYRVRVGEVRADLTYDRGVMAMASPWNGADLALEVVNGEGLNESTPERLYDENRWKSVVGRLSQEVGSRIRLGGLYYLGRERSGGHESTVRIWGPDATLSPAPGLELNLQLLRRTDDNPFFRDTPRCGAADARCPTAGGGDPRRTTVDMYLAEAIYAPGGPGGSWFLTALYNRVKADRPAFRVRLGEILGPEGYLERYESVSLGAHYLARRNLRFMGEVTWDRGADRARLTLGAVTAF